MTTKNKFLRYAIIFLALIIIIASYCLPAPDGMTQSMFTILGILVATIILWLTVSISWPSLLCIFALGFVPELGGFKVLFKEIFTFENLTIIYLILSYIFSYTLSKTMLFKRITVKFLSSDYAKKGPWSLIISLFTAILIIGCFVPPVVLYVAFLPIIESLLKIVGVQKGEKLGSMFIIGLAFTASISSGMTPFSHIFSAIACEKANVIINFGEYMLMAVPTGIILMALMMVIFRFVMRPDTSKLQNLDLTQFSKELKTVSSEEIIGIIALCIVSVMTVIPSVSLSRIPSIDRIIITIIFAFIALMVALGFDMGMKAVMEINTPKMANPAGIFSIFTIVTYVASIILTSFGHEILAFILMIILSLIFLISYVIMFIKNVKSDGAKIKIGKLPLIFIIVGTVLMIVYEVTLLLTSEAQIYQFVKNLSEYTLVMPVILGIIMLCIYVKEKPLLSLSDALTNAVPWKTICLLSAGFAITSALTNSKVGLKQVFELIINAIGSHNAMALFLFIIIWTVIQSNIVSGLPTILLVVGSSFTLLFSSEIDATVMVCIVGMISSFNFVLPSSSTQTALAGGSEYTSVYEVSIYGILMSIITFVLVSLVVYPLASNLLF